MPQIVSHVRLIVSTPVGTPERVRELWAANMKNMAEHINTRRKARIPDDFAFIARLAEPSKIGFENVLNPSFKSRAGLTQQMIVNNQGANLKRSFTKWQERLDDAFATVEGVPAKRFKDGVDRGKETFAHGAAERTLLFTGARVEGLGLAPIAARWLTGDPTVEGYLRGGDEVYEGGPYLVTSHEKKPALKAMLTQRLIQVGATIVKSAYDAGLISAMNQTTCEEVQGFVDPVLDLIPFVAAGDSRVDYIVVDGQLYLEIKVSKM
jgi:hypothetical protein